MLIATVNVVPLVPFNTIGLDGQLAVEMSDTQTRPGDCACALLTVVNIPREVIARTIIASRCAIIREIFKMYLRILSSFVSRFNACGRKRLVLDWEGLFL